MRRPNFSDEQGVLLEWVDGPRLRVVTGALDAVAPEAVAPLLIREKGNSRTRGVGSKAFHHRSESLRFGQEENQRSRQAINDAVEGVFIDGQTAFRRQVLAAAPQKSIDVRDAFGASAADQMMQEPVAENDVVAADISEASYIPLDQVLSLVGNVAGDKNLGKLDDRTSGLRVLAQNLVSESTVTAAEIEEGKGPVWEVSVNALDNARPSSVIDVLSIEGFYLIGGQCVEHALVEMVGALTDYADYAPWRAFGRESNELLPTISVVGNSNQHNRATNG